MIIRLQFRQICQPDELSLIKEVRKEFRTSQNGIMQGRY